MIMLLGFSGLGGELSVSIGTFVRNSLGGTATLLGLGLDLVVGIRTSLLCRTATLLGLDLDIGLSRSNLLLGSLLGGTTTLLGLLGLSLNDSGLRDSIILVSFLSTSLLLLGGPLGSILRISQAMLLGRRGLLIIVLRLLMKLVCHIS